MKYAIAVDVTPHDPNSLIQRGVLEYRWYSTQEYHHTPDSPEMLTVAKLALSQGMTPGPVLAAGPVDSTLDQVLGLTKNPPSLLQYITNDGETHVKLIRC